MNYSRAMFSGRIAHFSTKDLFLFFSFTLCVFSTSFLSDGHLVGDGIKVENFAGGVSRLLRSGFS